MRHAKEETRTSQATDMISAVKELHRLNSQELHRLLRDSENFTITYPTEKGSLIKVDMEKLAGSLPLHLTAVLISSNRDEKMFKYLLCGLRLLHSLFDLAPRHSKLEQVMLDDMKVLEQLIDLVFYMLVVLCGCRQEEHAFSVKSLVYSALVACNLYLLTGFISTQWQDLVHVLVVHPKVDLFMDAAFESVRMVVRCLEITLSSYLKVSSWEFYQTSERVIYHLCQQCEASLQFLQSLCQQKLFKERLLKNKELCGKGSILFLAQSILKLKMESSFPTKIMAAISRLKAKMLSILLSLCEAESISYLDEVASSFQSLNLAKSVASEVFDLLKTAFGGDPRDFANDRSYPMGLLQLNAMRLADIFSDDSNFRSYMTSCFTKVLTAIFLLSHGDFLSCWCSSDLPEKEEDATLDYDIFATVGWILDNTSSLDLLNATPLEFNLTRNSMPQASYAHHRTSLFVKVIANLHCFVPNICEEQERNFFVLKVQECLQEDLSSLLPGFSFASDSPKAAAVCKNLRSLLSHAESLIPNFLNEEDVQLLRVFFDQLQSLLSSVESEENRIQDNKVDKSLCLDKFLKLNINEQYQEAQSLGRCSSALPGKETTDLNEKSSDLQEGVSENSALPVAEQVNSRDVGISKGDDDITKEDLVEDKGISNKTASGGAVDMDKDTQNVDTSGSDTSSAKGKNVIDNMDNVELAKSSENIKKVGVGDNPENEKVDTVQRRKRKRNIMNDKQVTMIEKALLDEPEMQRNAAALQFWADKLSLHGSEVTSSQLKNWLNNRKARLARTASRKPDATDNSVQDKQRGRVGSSESPDSPSDASNTRKDLITLARLASSDNPDSSLAEVDGGPPEFLG